MHAPLTGTIPEQLSAANAAKMGSAGTRSGLGISLLWPDLLLLLDDCLRSFSGSAACCLLAFLLRQPWPSLCHVDQSGPVHEVLCPRRQAARNLTARQRQTTT